MKKKQQKTSDAKPLNKWNPYYASVLNSTFVLAMQHELILNSKKVETKSNLYYITLYTYVNKI